MLDVLNERIFVERADHVLDILCEEAHRCAETHGFWEHPTNHPAIKIALIHSEVSELLEATRARGRGMSKVIPNFSCAEDEAADIFIRLADLCRARGWRLGQAIIAKMKFNETRPHKHGKEF